VLLAPGWLYAGYKVAQAGPLPTTAEARHAYLTRRFPSYVIYQFLNETRGQDYAVYSLFDINMVYYAEGVFLGDIVGPARFPRITSKMGDSQALYAELRGLGITHLAINTEKEVVQLPDDDFFRRHFRLVHQHATGVLYELL
jgi:hypothetical protein